VPFLVAGAEGISDSMRIARWADEHGSGTSLFPDDLRTEIDRWNVVAEEALDSGRALFLGRLVDDREARLNVIPTWASNLSPLHAFVRARSLHVLKKYGAGRRTEDAHRERVRRAFDAVREALADGRRYLLGRFTFADIAVASSAQYLAPVMHPRVPVFRRSAGVWVVPGLTAEFGEVLRYRDALYASDR
jgi:glutathione S-transferase